MFRGVYCPSITLFTEDRRIDHEAMSAHLERVVSAGVQGVLVLGSIGEFFTLTPQEKTEITRTAVQAVGGRAQVLVGTADTDLRQVKALNQMAAQAGADAVVVVSPYYFGPSHAQARRFFGAVAKDSPLPVMLYNFPARTGSDLSPEFVRDLAATHPGIVGIKDTVDCLSHTRKVISAVRPVRAEFSVLSGFDEYYVGNRVAGGQGVLSGLTNVVPEVFVAMDRAWESGDHATALEQAARISRLMALYDVGDLFIGAVKQAAQLRGTPGLTAMRASSIDLEQEQVAVIEELLATV